MPQSRKRTAEEIAEDKGILLDNLFASHVTLIAQGIMHQEGEKYKPEHYIDEAYRLVMRAKHRIHEITLSSGPDNHRYW